MTRARLALTALTAFLVVFGVHFAIALHWSIR